METKRKYLKLLEKKEGKDNDSNQVLNGKLKNQKQQNGVFTVKRGRKVAMQNFIPGDKFFKQKGEIKLQKTI